MPWGDHAVVQTEVMGAGGGHQLLGTYSRYEWHHPGPAMFYLLYGPFKAARRQHGRAQRGGRAAGTWSPSPRSWASPRAAAAAWSPPWAGIVTGVYLLSLGADPLRDYWVPHAVVLPFGLYVVLCAACASGRVWFLPAAAFVGTFLMQTNLSMAGTVAALGGPALIACALSQDWLRKGPRLAVLRAPRASWRKWAPFALGAADRAP